MLKGLGDCVLRGDSIKDKIIVGAAMRPGVGLIAGLDAAPVSVPGAANSPTGTLPSPQET